MIYCAVQYDTWGRLWHVRGSSKKRVTIFYDKLYEMGAEESFAIKDAEALKEDGYEYVHIIYTLAFN